MKKILSILLVLMLNTTLIYAEEITDNSNNIVEDLFTQESICYNNESSILTAGRGCCSHHSGVCGCSNGRARCCDGTLSPSCGCMNDTPIPKLEEVKTILIREDTALCNSKITSEELL